VKPSELHNLESLIGCRNRLNVTQDHSVFSGTGCYNEFVEKEMDIFTPSTGLCMESTVKLGFAYLEFTLRSKKGT
jgi:hypothetical protein